MSAAELHLFAVAERCAAEAEARAALDALYEAPDRLRERADHIEENPDDDDALVDAFHYITEVHNRVARALIDLLDALDDEDAHPAR